MPGGSHHLSGVTYFFSNAGFDGVVTLKYQITCNNGSKVKNIYVEDISGNTSLKTHWLWHTHTLRDMR